MEGNMKLWILIITCFWWNSNSYSTFKTVLSTVVDEKLGAYETNTLISGPNGHCMDVADGNYTNGNRIIIWTCHSRSNQIWTFERDGTLRSNGKCLTTSASTQGSYIMIHDCNTTLPNTTIWQLRDDNVIVNPPSGRVLTAISGRSGTTLTLETNIYSSFQTWRASNDTTQSLVSIIGFNALCLHETDNAVWMAICESGNLRQQWLLYQDGTIRTQRRQNRCLSIDNLINKRVVILTCGVEPSNERWTILTENGTIYNQASNLFLDLSEVIVYPPTGNRNQKWEILPVSN